MKTMRMLVGVVLGMLTMTVVAESIEFAIVSVMLGKSFDYLSTHQAEYFAARNQTGVLIAKMLYNSIAAIAGGYVTTWVARHQVRTGVALMIGIQVSALVWGGFFSALAETGPQWMWLALILVMLCWADSREAR